MTTEGEVMRTNIVLDDKLVKKGMNYTGIRTKKDLVEFALRELIPESCAAIREIR
jgi:Arc/MetJ family transcription regulator